MNTNDTGLPAKAYVEQRCTSSLLIKNLRTHLNIFLIATYCGSTNTVGKGVRRTKTIGARKIRLCKSCKRKFTPKNQKTIASDPEQ